MLIIALMMRPWILLCNIDGLINARVLADDLLLLGVGTGHLQPFVTAFSRTHEFLHDMGARISADKSFVFSNDSGIRCWLKKHWWPHLRTTIDVVLHCRDLGAHLNTTSTNVGSTLTRRMTLSLAKLSRLRYVPISTHRKLKIILSGVYSGALYGCEATFASESTLARLSTAALDCIGHTGANRSPGIRFGLVPDADELDPVCAIFLRRATMLRRMLVKHPGILSGVKDIPVSYTHLTLPTKRIV